MAEGKYANEQVTLTDKQRKSLRARNIAMAVCLAAFVVVLWFGTYYKLGANILMREL